MNKGPEAGAETLRGNRFLEAPRTPPHLLVCGAVLDKGTASLGWPSSVATCFLALPCLAWVPAEPEAASGWAWWGTRLRVQCLLASAFQALSQL